MMKRARIVNGGSGFTIVELIVVVAIVGILAGIAIPAYFNYLDSARRTITISTLDTLRKDLESYQMEFQQYPANIITPGFTDPGGNRVLLALTPNTLTSNIFSWDSYVMSGGTYTVTVKAIDTKHTVMYLTPTGILH